MLSTGRTEDEASYKSLLAANLNGLKKCQAKENKGDGPFGAGPVSSTQSFREEPNGRGVRYFGHSRSDSFDARAPPRETGVLLNV